MLKTSVKVQTLPRVTSIPAVRICLRTLLAMAAAFVTAGASVLEIPLPLAVGLVLSLIHI